MLVYKNDAKELKTVHSEVTCPSCQESDYLDITIFAKYLSLYWIPFISTGKKSIAYCRNCTSTYESKQMTSEMRIEADKLKKDSKIPLWSFSGLGIVIVLVSILMFSIRQDNKQDKAYVSSPQTDDVYTYKTENDYYTTFKIIELTEDSVIVNQNIMEIDKSSGISEIDVPENYQDYYYIYGKKELIEMYEDGTITDVER
jgi:hypothetical protein